MNLYEQLKTVQTKDDLVAFIQSLRNDFQTNKNEWQNLTIDDYLESIEAWMTDTSSIPEEPNWKTLAQIIYIGKIYE